MFQTRGLNWVSVLAFTFQFNSVGRPPSAACRSLTHTHTYVEYLGIHICGVECRTVIRSKACGQRYIHLETHTKENFQKSDQVLQRPGSLRKSLYWKEWAMQRGWGHAKGVGETNTQDVHGLIYERIYRWICWRIMQTYRVVFYISVCMTVAMMRNKH